MPLLIPLPERAKVPLPDKCVVPTPPERAGRRVLLTNGLRLRIFLIVLILLRVGRDLVLDLAAL